MAYNEDIVGIIRPQSIHCSTKMMLFFPLRFHGRNLFFYNSVTVVCQCNFLKYFRTSAAMWHLMKDKIASLEEKSCMEHIA